VAVFFHAFKIFCTNSWYIGLVTVGKAKGEAGLYPPLFAAQGSTFPWYSTYKAP